MHRFLCLSLLPLAFLAAHAGDAKTEWRNLLDGGKLDAWQSTAKGAPKGWTLEDGTLSLGKGGGYIWTKDRFGDFVLDLEVNTTGNSGVFIRTDKLSDPVQTGIEVQVDNPSAKPGKHSFGAFYDLVAPKGNPAKKGEWTRLVITAKGPSLKVEMNGELINEMDLDKWSEAGQNPDGTKNKYTTALKDFKREGHIGFQDHGAAVKYRNIKIKSLDR
jgi:hypothetical protein